MMRLVGPHAAAQCCRHHHHHHHTGRAYTNRCCSTRTSSSKPALAPSKHYATCTQQHIHVKSHAQAASSEALHLCRAAFEPRRQQPSDQTTLSSTGEDQHSCDTPAAAPTAGAAPAADGEDPGSGTSQLPWWVINHPEELQQLEQHVSQLLGSLGQLQPGESPWDLTHDDVREYRVGIEGIIMP